MKKFQKWKHLRRKLRKLGPEKLTEAELLTIFISISIKSKLQRILQKILYKFGTFNKRLEDIKIIRIVVAFEIARKMVREVLKKYEQKEQKTI